MLMIALKNKLNMADLPMKNYGMSLLNFLNQTIGSQIKSFMII